MGPIRGLESERLTLEPVVYVDWEEVGGVTSGLQASGVTRDGASMTMVDARLAQVTVQIARAAESAR